nr:uncharacterized protein LOC132781493 [Anolis sagrei ordinatus]
MEGGVCGSVLIGCYCGSASSTVENSPSEEGAQEEARGLNLEGNQSGSDSVCTEELAAMFQAGMVDLRLNSESEGEEDAVPQHPRTQALAKEWGQAAWSPSAKESPSRRRTGSLSSLGDKISSLSQMDANEATMEVFGHHPPCKKGHQPLDLGEWDNLPANNGEKASRQGSQSFEVLSEWVQALHENPSRPFLVGDLDHLEMDAPPIRKPMSDGYFSARAAQLCSLEMGHASCLAAHSRFQNGHWAPSGDEGRGGLLLPGGCSPSENDRTDRRPVLSREKWNTGGMDLAGASQKSLVFTGSGHMGALCPEGCREALVPTKYASVELRGRGDQPELTKGHRQCPECQLHQTGGSDLQLQLKTACGMMSHKEVPLLHQASQLASERDHKVLEDHVQQLEAQVSSLKLQLRNSKVELATLKEMAGKVKHIQEAIVLEREEELSRLREIVEALGVKSEARSRAMARLEEEKARQVEALRQEAQREKEKDLHRVREELRREKQEALQELAEKMEQASARALWEQAARFRLDAEDLRKAIAERDARLLRQEDAQRQKAKASKQEAEEMVQKALIWERERWEADSRATLWALREQNQKALLCLQEGLEEERRAKWALRESAGRPRAVSIPGREGADPPMPRALWPLEEHLNWKAQLALEFKEELNAEMEKRRSRDKPAVCQVGTSRKEREMPPSEMHLDSVSAFHSPCLSAMLSSQCPFASPDLLGRLRSHISERWAKNAACCCACRKTLGSFQDDRGKSCASQGPSAAGPSS